MTYQNLWDTANAILRGKFIAMTAYIKRTERSQINELMLHLKLLEKQEQANPKTKLHSSYNYMFASCLTCDSKNNHTITNIFHI
jgi:hypothetical protein